MLSTNIFPTKQSLQIINKVYFDASLIRLFYIATRLYSNTSIFQKTRVIPIYLEFQKAFDAALLKAAIIFPTRFSLHFVTLTL